MFRFLLSIIEGFFGLFAPRRPLTRHARERMRERRISEADIDLTIAHGKKSYSDNAITYSIGKREIRTHGDKLKRCRGIVVVCALDNRAVITAFRRAY